jgi:hypothetical protein
MKCLHYSFKMVALTTINGMQVSGVRALRGIYEYFEDYFLDYYL